MRKARRHGLFLLQWVLNALWTPLFFAMHRAGWAFAEIVVLWQVRAAAVLNFAIWRLNRLTVGGHLTK
jgi:benzodiazapine receptor